MGLYEDMMEQQKQNVDPETNLPMDMIIGNRRMTGGQQAPMISQEEYEKWHAAPAIPDVDTYKQQLTDYYKKQKDNLASVKGQDPSKKAAALATLGSQEEADLQNAEQTIGEMKSIAGVNNQRIQANYDKYQTMYKMAGGGQTASDPSFDLYNRNTGQHNRQVALNNKNIGGYQQGSTPTTLMGDRPEMYFMPLQQQASAPVDVPLEPAKLEKMPGFDKVKPVHIDTAKTSHPPTAKDKKPVKLYYPDTTGSSYGNYNATDRNIVPTNVTSITDPIKARTEARRNFENVGLYKKGFIDNKQTYNVYDDNGKAVSVTYGKNKGKGQEVQAALFNIFARSPNLIPDRFYPAFSTAAQSLQGNTLTGNVSGSSVVQLYKAEDQAKINDMVNKMVNEFLRLNPDFINVANRPDGTDPDEYSRAVKAALEFSAYTSLGFKTQQVDENSKPIN